MRRTGRITCNALDVTPVAADATRLSDAIPLQERHKNGEATPLEVFQLDDSLLFFAHATINFQTASEIIQDNRKGVIEDFEKSLRSNRHRKQFNNLSKNTAATGDYVVDGNAKVIRGIRSINNKDDFFAGIVRTRKGFDGHKGTSSEKENIIVNDDAGIHPMKLYELGKQERRQFITLAKQASQGKISDATLKARFDSLLKIVAASPSTRNTSHYGGTTEAVNTLATQLQQETQAISIGRHEIMLMMAGVDELTDLVCSKIDTKYTKWWRLIWRHTSKLVTELWNTYKLALRLEKEVNEFVDKDRFNLQQGIKVANVFIHFVCTVFDQFKDNIEELISDIKKLNADIEKEKANNICPICKQTM